MTVKTSKIDADLTPIRDTSLQILTFRENSQKILELAAKNGYSNKSEFLRILLKKALERETGIEWIL
tara:strand:+ start:420 stop:620 length:201 start_codon:yes stop_codon:yes gene_type:complete